MDITQAIFDKAKANPQRIVYPEGTDIRIIKAAAQGLSMGITQPILIGEKEAVEALARQTGINLEGIQILDSKFHPLTEKFAEMYSRERDIRCTIAAKLVKKPLFFFRYDG